MEKQAIQIRDFDLFCELMFAAQKIVDSAKINVNETGVQIYGIRQKTARCELESNAIFSTQPLSFCISEMQTFTKILQTIQQVHGGDYSSFEFYLESPYVKFKSKKFKTKYITCLEEVIQKWVSAKMKAEFVPVFQFQTTSDMIKQVLSHQFIFSEKSSLRIYLETSSELENNSVFATLGNKSESLNNEITLKMGLITYGKYDPERPIIIDVDRLILFNAFQSDSIQISLMDKNALIGKVSAYGKNDTFFDLTICNSLLKA